MQPQKNKFRDTERTDGQLLEMEVGGRQNG